MYNLTVEDAHTFFVGDGDWLVHNTCTPTREQVQHLKDLGLDRDTRRDFFEGRLVLHETPSVKGDTTVRLLQYEDGVVRTGIFSVNDKGTKTGFLEIRRWAKDSKKTAEVFGVDEIEFVGAVAINDMIESGLKGRGFEFETIKIPPELLGEGAFADIWKKRVPTGLSVLDTIRALKGILGE